MNRPWTIMTALALLAASGALTATADADGEREHRRHGGGPYAMHYFGDPGRLLEQHLDRILDLDETQSQNISNILSAAKPEIDDLRERTHENFAAMHDLDPESADYATQLQNLASENGRLASEATLLHGRLRADIQAELTPEQRQTLEERGQHMRRRFEERFSGEPEQH